MREKRRLGRPPKSAVKDRHADILDAALDLFSTYGYAATSIRQIAESVGVSDPALYSHFKSKGEILAKLFEIYGPKAVYSASENLDLNEGIKNPKQFAINALHSLAERWFHPAENKFFRLLLIENLTGNIAPSMKIRTLQEPMRQRLKTLATWLIATKRSINIDPDWMVAQFMDPIAAIRTEVAMAPQKENLAQTQARLTEHFENFVKVFLPNL